MTKRNDALADHKETFEGSFYSSLYHLQDSIREHIDKTIGSDKERRKKCSAIFPLALDKVIQQHQTTNTHIPYSVLILAHNPDFEIVDIKSILHFTGPYYASRPDSQLACSPLPNCFIEIIDDLLREGVIYEHFLLSELQYVTSLCAEYLEIGEIASAVEILAHAHQSYGAYRNYRLWRPREKQGCFKKVDFKRKTLLKMIYSMAAHGYKYQEEQTDVKKASKINAINHAVHLHTHSIPLKVISGFLSEACREKALGFDRHIKEEPGFDSYNRAVISLNRPPSQDERAAMLTIIISMAIDKYGYKIDQRRNGTPGEILKKMDLQVIKLDEDTIRGCLNEAKEILLAL